MPITQNIPNPTISRIETVFNKCDSMLVGIKNSRGKRLFNFTNVWNSQLDEILQDPNKTYPFAFPAAFVEFEMNECKMLLNNISTYPDFRIRIHFANQSLNDGDSMDRDLEIFKIRDQIKNEFADANIDFCTNPICIADKLDYKHGQIYKYILEYKTMFTEIRGSKIDTMKGYSAQTNLNMYMTNNLIKK